VIIEQERAGLPVEVAYLSDLDHAVHSPEEIASEVLRGRPDVVGFGMYAWNQYAARKAARLVKEAEPDILVVGGGPWVSAETGEFAAENAAFDVLVQGDGELPFTEIVRRLATGAGVDGLAGIPGAVVRTRGGLAETPRIPHDPNLLPSPYRLGLIPAPLTLRIALRRGCTMRCAYCNWGNVRSHRMTAESLRADLSWARERRIDEVWMLDSAINRRMDDLEVLARGMEAVADARFHTCGYVDYRLTDPARLELLRRCRVRAMNMGIQSINPAALAMARRRFDREAFERAVERLRAFEYVAVDMILGLPGDDAEGFVRTVDYLRTLDLPIMVFNMIGLPGSEFYRRRGELGLVFNEEGLSYLVSSSTFSEEDMVACAGYFVTEVARKGRGSNFTARTVEFSRYPFNYRVPYDAYVVAHERHGEPLPPEPSIPGTGGRGDVKTELTRAVVGILGDEIMSGLKVGAWSLRLGAPFYDRVLIDARDPAGRAAEVFFRRGDPRKDSFARVSGFDVWYGKGTTMDERRAGQCLKDIIAFIEARGLASEKGR
jgi:radical SAM superfamily enzyme YgiQ (UPF0313 family)